MSVRGITGMQRPRELPRAGPRSYRQSMATMTGWLGHQEIPQPARVRREHPGPHVDWLDCLLALWIAEAMLASDGEDR